MKQEDLQKALEAVAKSGITVNGDLVLEKHVENEIGNVENGGIGIQILNGNDTPISKCDKVIKEALEEQPDFQRNHDEELTKELLPIFYNNQDDVELFLKQVRGMQDKDITDLVNRWVKDKRISDYGNSRKGDLWSILNRAGLYTKSKQNWNMRVD